MYLEFEITNSSAKSRVRRLAERQHGRVTWAQLEAIDLAGSTLTAWVANGYLHSVLPRVYAVGHSAPSVEADLMAAVLYAGPGAMLSHASAAHQPKLAWTKSQLEVMLVEICESEGIPVPEINKKVNGWEVDADWPQAKLVVELDGYGNHHTPAQLKRDRRKEMALRSISITVIRYSGDQLRHDRRAVSSELQNATRPSAH